MIVTLGRTSRGRLATCCPPIRQIITAAAEDSKCPCDFGVVCGARGEKAQNEAKQNGKSNAKWGESDHNVMRGPTPFSMGVDVAPYDPRVKDYVWDGTDPRYAALARHILATAERLGYKLEWGGNYTSISDKPHYSLRF